MTNRKVNLEKFPRVIRAHARQIPRRQVPGRQAQDDPQPPPPFTPLAHAGHPSFLHAERQLSAPTRKNQVARVMRHSAL